MQYRQLGQSGLRVSALSFGSWLTFGDQVDDATAKAMMYKAYDHGVNFFDNAEVYAQGKSETVMGQILADAKWSRDSYIVSSKVFWGGSLPTQWGLSRKHIRECCEAALKRLQVEYLDLYFCHRPDLTTPMEETVRAMTELILQGRILYWGTSEWSAQEIQEAHMVARQYGLIPPLMEQPQYNMFHRERFEKEYFKLFRDMGMGSTIWSPLAGGLLSGKYNEGLPSDSRALAHQHIEWLFARFTNEEANRRLNLVSQLGTIAVDLGVSLAQLSLAWCLTNPHVSTVITGSSKVSQVEDNMKALAVLPLLTPEVLAKIELLLGNKPTITQFGAQ